MIVNKIISQYIEIGSFGVSCWRLALKKEMSACHLETYVTTKRPNDTFKETMLRDDFRRNLEQYFVLMELSWKEDFCN
jgi:hypothetical protein